MADPVAMETNCESEMEIKDEPLDDCIPHNMDGEESCLIEDSIQDMPYVDDSCLVDDSLLIEGEFSAEPFSDVTLQNVEDDMPGPVIEEVFSLAKDLEIGEVIETQEMDIAAQVTEKTHLTSHTARKAPVFKDKTQHLENPVQQTVSSQPSRQSTTVTTESVVINKSNNRGQLPLNQKQTTASGSASLVNLQRPAASVVQMAMLQKIMNIGHAGIQAPVNVPQMGIQTLGMMQNVANVPGNQQVNMLQLGVPRPGAGLPVLGALQNRIRIPQVPMRAPRLGVPHLSVPLHSVPQLGFQQNARGIPQLGLQSLRATGQEQMIRAQLNLLKNINMQQLGPNVQLNVQQQALHLAQLNALKKMCVPQLGAQTEQRNASQLAMQVHAQQLQQSVGRSHLTLQQNLLNVQQQRARGNPHISNVSQLSANSPRVANNISQLTTHIPQLRVPQLANMLRFGAPQLTNVPQLRMPQLAANIQHLARNVRQLSVPPPPPNVSQINVPQLASNVPQGGVPQLSSNLRQIGVPHVASTVPHFTVRQLVTTVPQGVRKMSPVCVPQPGTNTSRPPQLGNNMSHLPVPQIAASNVSRFGVPLLPTNVPQLTIPQPTSNIPRLGVPLPPGSVPQLGVQRQLSISQTRTNVPPLAVQPIVTRVPQVASSVPRVGIPQLPINLPRLGALQPTTNVSHVRMPQSTQLSLQLQKTKVPQFCVQQIAQTTQLAAKQRTECMPWSNEKHQVGGQQNVTGVKRQLSGVLQQSVNTSQQSASAPQPVDRQKRIVSQPTNVIQKIMANQKEQIILKHIQRKRMKRQLALLNLWKRYERYRAAKSLSEIHGKTSEQRARIRRRLFIQQHIVTHKKLQN